MSRPGERSTRPRGRPKEELRRPKHVAIADGLVTCRHRGCHHEEGPYGTRDEAVRAAIAHHATRHKRA